MQKNDSFADLHLKIYQVVLKPLNLSQSSGCHFICYKILIENSIIYVFMTEMKQKKAVQMDIFLPLSRAGLAGLHVPLDVCSDATQYKLLTQPSKNIRRNKERLSGQQPQPASSKHLTNPDVKSKLHQLPKQSYVTSLMGQRFCAWPYTGGLSPTPTRLKECPLHFVKT